MIINGQGRPKLIIVDAVHPTSGPIDSILLPYCEKLTTTREVVQTVHDVQGGKLSAGYGWRYSFTLDYSGYIDGQTLVDMANMFAMAGITASPTLPSPWETRRALVLIPRIDAQEISHNVIFTGGFSESIIPGIGHKDVVFEFVGMDIEPYIVLRHYGWGSHYGCKNADGSAYVPGWGATI
jgi:hypothetical protein